MKMIPRGSAITACFSKPITSLQAAHEFFDRLAAEGLLFHPEDSPDSIVDSTGELLFTPEEAALIEERIAEVHEYDADPCAYCVRLNDDQNPRFETVPAQALASAPNPSLMDRYLATDCPVITMPHERGAFEPLKTPGHRLIVAAGGLYKEIRRAWVHAIVLLASARTPFGALQQSLSMPFVVPEELLFTFLEQARAAAPNETAAWIVWHELGKTLRLVPMEYDRVSPVHLTVRRPVLAAGEHMVVDLHSHHHMPAVFSSTDNLDDIASNEVKMAGVVGTIDQPTWNFRMCLEGVLVPEFLRLLRMKELP